MNPKDDADFVKLVGHSKFDPLAGVPYEPALPRVALVADGGATAALEALGREVDGEAVIDPARSESGNSMLFAREHGGQLLHVGESDQWFRWDGRRFKSILPRELEQIAKRFAARNRAAARRAHDDDLEKHWRRSESRKSIQAMTALARGEPQLAVFSNELDSHPLEVNVANGILDLRTLDLREHDRAARHTKLIDIPFIADARAPRWGEFLREVFPDDPDTIEFLRRSAGYALTGDVSAQAFLVLHGRGSNGKTVFAETIGRIIGEYGISVDYGTFLEHAYQGGPRPDLVRMRGARFCKASEGSRAAKLDVALLKRLTGGEPVVARGLYQSDVEFHPEAKLWLQSNFRPSADDPSAGLWRRLLLVEFRQRFEGKQVDPNLMDKLAAEAPGILAWICSGAHDWLKDGGGMRGLCVSPSVRDWSMEYRIEEDRLRPFLDACVTFEKGLSVRATDLYARYSEWTGSYPLSQRKFSQDICAREGIGKTRDRFGVVYAGIGLARKDDPRV